jgi:peptide/nickel transport system substrate-binding protein
VPHTALAPFVVGPTWEQGTAVWPGPPSDLLVREDAPWLVEVARALAIAMSTPSHEITGRPISAMELAQRRSARAFALMLDVARPAGPGALGAILGLATADDVVTASALARHPPRGDQAPRRATRAMRVGVVGEVRLEGGRTPDLVLPPSPSGRGIEWGAAFRARR